MPPGTPTAFLSAYQLRLPVKLAVEYRSVRILPCSDLTDSIGRHVLDQRRAHLVENLHGPLRHAALPVWTRRPLQVSIEPKVPS